MRMSSDLASDARARNPQVRLVCVSENIENGPEMSARLTIESDNNYSFSEISELAGPGEDLQPFTAITFTRVPGLSEGQ